MGSDGGSGAIERIAQSEKDSCQNACVAMLTGRDERALIEEYGTPLGMQATRECLEAEYEYVRFHDISISGVRVLCELVENLIVGIESPLRERDPGLWHELREADIERKIAAREERTGPLTDEQIEGVRRRTTVQHAIVVHRGRIYDPRDPPYFETLGGVGHIGYDRDYEVRDVWVCMDREPVFEFADDGWPSAAGWSNGE